MKKLGLFTLAAAFAFSLLLPASAASATGDTVAISTAEEFLRFSNDCVFDDFATGKTFKLTADIDLTSHKFSGVPFFNGSFDGGGHTVKADIELPGENVGLFRIVEKDGVIENLTFSGSVTATQTAKNVGGIAGTLRGTIRNCSSRGSVFGTAAVGGIAGLSDSSATITDCDNAAEVVATSQTGGIAGRNLGTVTGCTNTGSINPGQNKQAMTDTGGIAGRNDGMISACQNRGEISAYEYGTNAGGIAGNSVSSLSDCINYGEVAGNSQIGGIVGNLSATAKVTLEANISYGKIRGFTDVGGIAGRAGGSAEISRCIAFGNVTAKNNNVGGIGGNLSATTLILSCAARCEVTSTSGAYAGGIAGTGGNIRLSLSVCTVKATAYAGGIAGKAAAISTSYSVSEVFCEGENVGSIAGSIDGNFANNYFLENALPGVAGVNYRGKAEPVTFADLVSDETALEDRLPGFSQEDWQSVQGGDYFPQQTLFHSYDTDFKDTLLAALSQATKATVKVSFYADGKLILATDIKFGGTLGSDSFPDVPQKAGYFGAWDGSAENVIANLTINAVYTRAAATLAPASGLPLLIEGCFPSGTAFDAQKISFDAALPIKNYTVRDAYSLDIDYADGVTVRVKAEGLKNPKIAYLRGDEVVLIDCEQSFSYLVFTLPYPTDFAVIEQGLTVADFWWIFLLAAAVILAAAITAAVLVKRNRRRTHCFKNFR